MLRDDYYWDCPEEQIDPPYKPLVCEECGEVIRSNEDACEIRGLFPRVLCERCGERAEDDGEFVGWFIAC